MHTVWGSEALRVMFVNAKANIDNPKAEAMTFHHVRPFRTFSWMLGADMNREVQTWIGTICMRAEVGSADASTASSLCDVLAVASKVGSSSSSSAMPALAKTKHQLKIEAKKQGLNAGFLKFFTGSGKVAQM